jgi:hypothetical protein
MAAVLAMVALALMLPAVIYAQPAPPHIFTGSATVNGVAAANGVAVTAWIDGAQVPGATGTVAAGRYTLQVVQPDGVAYAGKSVRFRIGASDATQSQSWVQGDATVLNLTSTGGTTPPPPPPPPPPPVSVVGPAGPKGDTGSAGAPGAAGPPGAVGPVGAAGAAGKDSGRLLAWIALIVAIVAIIGVAVALMKKPHSEVHA